MVIDSFVADIKSFLLSAKAKTETEKFSVCSSIYSRLAQSGSDAPDNLQWFFEHSEALRSNSTNSVTVSPEIPESELEQLRQSYGKLVDALLETELSQNLDVCAYYKRLWDIISITPSLDSNDAKVFALYYIWIDTRTPYYHLNDEIDMSNEEFKKRSISLYESIQKARFILNTNYFQQRTSRASELLYLIMQLNDENDRIVLVAHILSMVSLSPTLLQETLDAITGSSIK